MAMWLILEKAIKTFISSCLKQITPTNTPPQREKIISDISNKGLKIILLKTKIPIPPNFRRTPARIIEPNVGASTWALGSQTWKKKTGNFTTKVNKIENTKNICKGLSDLNLFNSPWLKFSIKERPPQDPPPLK